MPNLNLRFPLEDDRKDMVITHTNYECRFCGRHQSIVDGNVKDCIYCRKPLGPRKMYRHYPNSSRYDGSFTAEDVKRSMIELHTDYECPFCGRNQSVAQMGGYGADCIYCGKSSNPSKVT